MIRVLFFFAIVFALALGFAWIADLPGTVSVAWNGYVWEKTPVVATLVVGVLLILFLAAVWIVRVILKSPKIASRFFRQRRRDKGYGALSQGLIALGTGNAKLARRYGLEADRLLGSEPGAKLLLAQSAQLAGKDDEARQRFEAMLEDPGTKTLGLHGLFVEAERHGEPVAAHHYAEEAMRASPGLEWAGKAVLGYQAVAHHWDEALLTLERNYSAKLLEKKAYRRQRAVILTALAYKLEDGDPDRAFSLAKEAHTLALDLVPAAVIASRLATRRGDIRKAAKLIEATWRLSPHPDLAESYAHVRTGDSAVDRLKRVKALSAQRANAAEGAFAIAKAALEAREFDEARSQLKKLLQSEPAQAAFLLMADVEEAETGDKGRTRDWLARALKAPRGKAWVADGIVSSEWQPVSPVTGRLDAFQWSVPDAAGETVMDILEDSLFEAPALTAAAPKNPEPADPEPADLEPAVPASAKDITPPAPETVPGREAKDTASSEGSAPQAAARGEAALEELTLAEPAPTVSSPVTSPSPAASTPPASKVGSARKPASKAGYEGTTDDVKHVPPLHRLPDEPETSAAVETVVGVQSTPDLAPDAPAARKKAQTKAQTKASAPGASEESAIGDKTAPETLEKAEDTKEKAGAGKAEAKPEAENLNRPIEFALSRMPDDPGTDDEDADTKPQIPRPRFFN